MAPRPVRPATTAALSAFCLSVTSRPPPPVDAGMLWLGGRRQKSAANSCQQKLDEILPNSDNLAAKICPQNQRPTVARSTVRPPRTDDKNITVGRIHRVVFRYRVLCHGYSLSALRGFSARLVCGRYRLVHDACGVFWSRLPCFGHLCFV